MLKTLILLMLLGHAIGAVVPSELPMTEDLPCVDSDGNVQHKHGESWECDCATCTCKNGQLEMYQLGCALFQIPPSMKCSIRPGTENNCCPEHDCVTKEDLPCVDSDGNVQHKHGESWECDCATCTCINGQLAMFRSGCALFRLGPFMKSAIRPGTENNCCPSHDFATEEAISNCSASLKVAPSCPVSLCLKTCKGHPKAKCRISRCGGCSANFYENDEVVTCAGGPINIEPICPSVPAMACPTGSPCQSSPCEKHPNATCHADYCQECVAVYHDDNSNHDLNC